MKSIFTVFLTCLLLYTTKAGAQTQEINVTPAVKKPTEMDNSTYIKDKTPQIFETSAEPNKTDTQDNTSSTAYLCKNGRGLLVPYNKQYIGILSENDAYYNSYVDRYYTAGNRIVYTSKEHDYYCEDVAYKENPSFKRSKLWWLGKITLLRSQHVTKWDIGIAQEMYTPKNKYAPFMEEEDYPYAGYLYLSLGITNRNSNTEERLKLHLGVVGPAALAQYTQDFIHTAFGVGGKLPGWDSQIHNEPIFNLHYQLTKKYYIFNTKYISADVLPAAAVALGNANTYVALSGRLRIGYNLGTDFGVSKINHAIDSSPPHSDKFSIYGFVGAGGRFVIKNIFISGNTFQKGTNLDITRFVYDLEGGVAMSIKGIRLSYTFSHRSKEFSTQASYMNFSTISLQIAF